MDSYNPLGIYQPSKARKPEPPIVRAAESSVSPRSLGGGRATVDSEENIFTSALSVFTPLAADDYWRGFSLDSRTLDRVPLNKLVELLAELSPDVSKALWDFLRFANPGYEMKAFKPGTEDVDEVAQASLLSFIGQLHGPYSVGNIVPFDVVIASMFIAMFLRGALCCELVLDKTGKMPLELATPDPATIKFKRVPDAERGTVWQIGQYQGKALFVPIDKPTVCYVPVDPLPGKPQGRALAAPAVFSCLFLIGLLHDLRRVVAQQGYPRLDIEINTEKLLAMMPANLSSDSNAKKAWVDGCTKAIKDAYAALEPDDAYVHPDVSKVNRPVGTLDASSLAGSKDIIASLERFTVRALKSMPFLFGINESTTETLANRQYEAHIAGIKAIQHLAETVLEKQLTLALRVQGIQAAVQFRFAELRAAEMLRDAQTEALKIRNAQQKYNSGWISQDEAAQQGAGKDKADAATPRVQASTTPANSLLNVQAEPGANRGLPTNEGFERIN